jgi:hypothetical protein
VLIAFLLLVHHRLLYSTLADPADEPEHTAKNGKGLAHFSPAEAVSD